MGAFAGGSLINANISDLLPWRVEKRQWKCGLCGQFGHHARVCTVKKRCSAEIEATFMEKNPQKIPSYYRNMLVGLPQCQRFIARGRGNIGRGSQWGSSACLSTRNGMRQCHVIVKDHLGTP